ncbi:Signal transduction histidine kinase [Georgenia satyanarayanai]|uniref:Sensor-like histidine kinase SenX3 n=1 Tax=Georgenia satyanarayanai TaxID=860221 RepID=A0A2Y9AH15_9MICO|nr:PAS domain-containing sensor histidine kinase [Georgenia satyanarayanai]PYF99148.1 signal transduction histidine kinase [Georgenia satyanarayanai]SSA43266.1 Signal transduction histidine kinase [Georgenia satyanarayanai]
MPRQPASLPAETTQRRFAVLGRQLPFFAVFGVMTVALTAWQEYGPGLPDPVLVGAAVNLLATALAAAVPWPALPRWAETVVPLLDMVAVVCVLTVGARASVLIILPVVWLAAMGRTATIVAVTAGVASSMGVDIVRAVEAGALAITPDNAARMFVVPAAVIAVATSLHLSEKRSTARRELLAGQSALVEELLEDTAQDRARLEGVLNTIDAGVAVLDPRGAVVVANRALREASRGVLTVGARLTDALPRLLTADGVTPVDPARLAGVVDGERVSRRVVWWEYGPADRAAFRISSAPLPHDGAGSEGTVVALHDVTDELLALSQRDDFVSSVSHELRTPLTSVTGYLDLAVDDPDVPPHVAGYLEVAERNAGRLRILIDNLLSAARTASDVGSREDVDLHAVIADVVESQTPRAVDRDIEIATTAEGSGIVCADVGRLTQVVDNVVSNAVKYSHPGGHVSIELRDEGSKVRLVVADDGPGIPEADQRQLFTRFYRAPEVRHTAVQGTGLGLHISRQIVEALGGSIALSSEPGRGTRVEIVLPAGVGR